MRRPSRSGLLWLIVLATICPLAAQNLETIGKQKPFSISGGVSFNQIFHTAHGTASRREPYSYFASANVNVSIYGWNIPLTAALSNHRTRFSQPFNQYALHPTWKSVTAHAGYTSMSYSPYTVNGHVFRGGGLEVTPGEKWKLSAFYGRLLKAVEADSGVTQPCYQRKGYGLKATYTTALHSIDLIVFSAGDDASSIAPPADSLEIRPQENFVVSIGASHNFLKNFNIKAELANSALTRDTRSERIADRHPFAVSRLFRPRQSSSYYQALKSSIDYHYNGWVIGLGYERIDPEYRTLGAYYFNNDLENITVNSSGALLKGTLNMAFTMGVQNDNIEHTRISTMRRIVSAVNVEYAPSQRLNLSGAWSTFQTYTNIRSQFESINQLSPYEHLDTLNFTQISRNASFSGMLSLPGSEYKKHSVHVNVSWQQAMETRGKAPEPSGTQFLNLTTGYSLALLQENTSLSLTFNATRTQGPFIFSTIMGPNASVTKSFLARKFRTTLSTSWNKSYTYGRNTSSIINGRWSGVVSIRKKHNINISAAFINRALSDRISPPVKELTATVGYNYSVGSGRTSN